MMRYDGIIRAVTAFFAALIGFGLKHLLDLETIHPLFDYRRVCFVIAILLYLRFLTGSASHLWLEHVYAKGPSAGLFVTDIVFLITFGIIASLMSYAEDIYWFLGYGTFLLSLAFLWGIVTAVLQQCMKITAKARWGCVWAPLNIIHGLVFGGALWYSFAHPDPSAIHQSLCLLATFSILAVIGDLRWQIYNLDTHGQCSNSRSDGNRRKNDREEG